MTGQFLTLRAALRLVAQGMRRRAAQPAWAPAPHAAVERDSVRIDTARLRGFLAVTHGDRVPALAAADAPLPPTLPCLWETALALDLLAISGLGFPRGGLVHLESEVLPIRSMHRSNRFRSRVELDRVEPHARGRRLVLRSRCWNETGLLCQESTVALLALDPPSSAGGRVATSVPVAAALEPEEPVEWRTLREWLVPANLGRRYARVSGDFNPIHLWPWSARLMGFQRPLLHGFCIEGLVAHALIAEMLGGDPCALRRLQISFRAPLFLPARVRLTIAEPRGNGRRFRLVDASAPSRRPYAEGTFAGVI